MKQRLVGALILLSGGVVLWSILFTGPAAYKVNEATQIPSAPVVTQPPPIEPQRPRQVPEVADPEPLPEPPVPALTSANKKVATEPPKTEPVQASPTPRPAEPPKALVSTPAKVAEKQKPSADKAAGDMPQAWVIQVASFSSEANAESLKKRLSDKGYDAYVKPVKTPSGSSMQRVFVGPELKKSQAEKHKAEIESAFKLKALLHEYAP